MSAVLKVLVPVDGAVPSLQAVQHVVDLVQRGLAVEVHLLNVQAPLRGSAAMLIAKSALEAYHRDEGMTALAGAVTALAVVGITPHLHVAVGSPGRMVLGFIERLGCALVVMGTRGYGGGVAGR